MTRKLAEIEAYIERLIVVITFIFLCICLISLVTSVTSNIIQQKKEIAILRAVGLTQRSIMAIYLTESLLTVLTSCAIGICVGCFLGYVLAAQQAIFTEIFVGFDISLATLGAILAIAILLALVSTIGPIRALVGQPISQILRES